MSKICTDINQSKKLIELGLDVNTADMCYPYNRHLNRMYGDTPYVIVHTFNREVDISAWSLSALLKLFGDYTMQTDTTFRHFIVSDKYITNSYDEPVDAAFEMVVWLIENRKI